MVVALAPTDWLTRMQAAAVLHCGLATTDRRIKACNITAIKHGRRVLVNRASLEAYLARCQGKD